MEITNHLNLRGIEFTEFSTSEPTAMHELFLAFGFSRIMRHTDKKIDLYRQNKITFLLNYEAQSFGSDFYKEHGPCVSSMGWRVDDANFALENAADQTVRRGALDCEFLELPFDRDRDACFERFGVDDHLLVGRDLWFDQALNLLNDL